MKKLNKRTFRFDVELKARKVDSEKRLYCMYVQVVYIRVQDMYKKEGENTERGENTTDPKKLAAACESAKRHQKRLMTLFFLSFSPLARYPHRQDAPWQTLKALGPSLLRYSTRLTQLLPKDYWLVLRIPIYVRTIENERHARRRNEDRSEIWLQQKVDERQVSAHLFVSAGVFYSRMQGSLLQGQHEMDHVCDRDFSNVVLRTHPQLNNSCSVGVGSGSMQFGNRLVLICMQNKYVQDTCWRK